MSDPTPAHSLLSSLALNGAILAAEVIAFTFMRRRFRLIYEPRSFSFFEAKRQPPLSSQLWGWPSSILFADHRKIKDINGLDSYFFVRFLRMMVYVMLPIWLISWAVLLPLTSINNAGVVDFNSGLYKFTFSNINATHESDRYFGQLGLTWIFTLWILWNIKCEMAHYVHIRQQYLVSPSHSSTAQARTVMVTGIPSEFLTESALIGLFSHLPGGVCKVWINRNLGDMPALCHQRLKASQMLESAATSLLNTAIKRNSKRLRNPVYIADGSKVVSSTELSNFASNPPETRETKQDTLMEELASKRKRPSHRLPLFSWMPFSVPLLGKKVDTIEWACDRIHKLNIELAQRREVLARDIARTTRAEENRAHWHSTDAEKSNTLISAVPDFPFFVTRAAVDFQALNEGLTYPPANGAFILFNKQIAAHMAAQTLTHHEPYRMPYSLKSVEAAPEDVIWKNLALNPYQRRLRLVLAGTAAILLVVVWTIPVSIVAIPSRLKPGNCIDNGFFGICNFAGKITGVFQNIFYNVLLLSLYMLVPVMFRILARWEGTTQQTRVELSIVNRVFAFSLINSFFLPALSSFLFKPVNFVDDILDVKTAIFRDSLTNAGALEFIRDLTASSDFFLSFIMLQGLSGTATGLLQAMPLVKYYVKITLFASTPRSVFGIKYSPRMSNWGTLFPSVTLLVVVTFGYSIISPIINGFAFVTFFLLYMLHKYHLTWVNDHPSSSDTGGLFFPKAIHHVFVGLYVQQIVLCTLFFLPLGDTKKPSGIPQGVLLLLLIIVTAFVHHIIHNSYGPLIKFLPQTLANVSHSGIVGIEKGTPQSQEAAPPQLNHADDWDMERQITLSSMNEPRSSSPFPSARPDGLTDFSHPAATEEQPVIWLPKDPLGLVHEIGREIASYGILYSTNGAEIDSKGRVHVRAPSPEYVRRDGGYS